MADQITSLPLRCEECGALLAIETVRHTDDRGGMEVTGVYCCGRQVGGGPNSHPNHSILCLQRQLASAKNLTWTNRKPEVAGWYWHTYRIGGRHRGRGWSKPACRLVTKGTLTNPWLNRPDQPDVSRRSYWAGPISLPPDDGLPAIYQERGAAE